METRAFFDAPLEVRRESGRPVIAGRFQYEALAVMSDRGSVRKETFRPGAFVYALEDPDREISFLSGHDFNKPLASKKRGTLQFEDGPKALQFEAHILPELADVSHVKDALALLAAGLAVGISPGFRVPPKETVPDAEKLVPEPGNPSVLIRQIFAAVLFELSLVTRPAYEDAQAELRAFQSRAHRPQRIWLP